MATNFLEAAGTNGFIATSGASMGGMSGLANATGTATGTQVFTVGPSGTLGGAQKGHAYFTYGAAFGSAPTAGAVLACWFLLSTDGGTTFETIINTASATLGALPRPPDFLIPVPLAVGAANNIIFATGPFRLPYLAFKVLLQNLSTQALPTGTNTITLGGVADQY